MTAADFFLTDPELAKLTGFKIKSKQIEWLRDQGLPFRVSATGHPVVTRSAVEGRADETLDDDGWTPGLIGA